MAKRSVKGEFLQIRISKADKDRIKREAKKLSVDVSELILSKILSPKGDKFRKLIRSMSGLSIAAASFKLAEIHDLLCSLTADEFTAELPPDDTERLDLVVANYVAAMIEHEAIKRSIAPPIWVFELIPAANPYFASSLKSLRLHLLINTPAAFKRRNLFIDSAPGARV